VGENRRKRKEGEDHHDRLGVGAQKTFRADSEVSGGGLQSSPTRGSSTFRGGCRRMSEKSNACSKSGGKVKPISQERGKKSMQFRAKSSNVLSPKYRVRESGVVRGMPALVSEPGGKCGSALVGYVAGVRVGGNNFPFLRAFAETIHWQGEESRRLMQNEYNWNTRRKKRTNQRQSGNLSTGRDESGHQSRKGWGGGGGELAGKG